MAPLDLSNYGQPVQMKTSEFTRDMQQDIISNHFSGTPGGVYNKMVAPANEQAAPTSNILQGRESGDTISMTRAQYNSLLNRGGMTTPNTAQPQQMNEQTPIQQQPNGYAPQQAPTNEPTSTNDFDMMLNDILGGEVSPPQQPQTTQVQQAIPPVQQEQTPVNQVDTSFEAMQEQQRLANYSAKMGVDSTEVSNFAQSLSVEDIVDLYTAVQSAKQQQQPQRQQHPQSLSESGGLKGSNTQNHFVTRPQTKNIF